MAEMELWYRGNWEKRAFEGERSQLSHVLLGGQAVIELSTGFGYQECGNIAEVF